MKCIFNAFCVLWKGLCGLTFFLSMPVVMAANVPLDKVAAIVNTSVITQSQLNTAMNELKTSLQLTDSPGLSPAELKKQALDQLILKTLQLEVAKRNKITVPDKEVDQAVNKIAEQNHVTLEQLKEALSRQGIGYAKFRSQIHDQILLRNLQQQLFAGNVKISEQDVRDFIRKNRALPSPDAQYYVDDLLIPVKENASAAEIAAAQKTAQTLFIQAEKGKTFGELASSASAGEVEHNDLGWRKLSDLPSLFAQAITGMKPNQLKSPIRAPNGFHLLKVMSVKGETSELSEEEAKNRLFQEKMKEQVDKWQKEIRQSAYIQILG